ncbi:MAG: hypothetical protein KAI28_00380, partial [Sphingomonadales bacterium]|nr:hypothetical protein [Sphingomonadales bacterium]
WVRADEAQISIGLHNNYNKDGRVDRAFFLPTSAKLIKGQAPLRLDNFKETGFFSSFALQSPAAADAVFSGILVLDKPNAGGLEAYSVAPKNDFARAAVMGEATPTAPASITKSARLNVSYVMAILLALVGGLILNVMPCVFPVLALKVFSVIQSSAAKEQHIRRDALSYTAGVIASFALLAGVLIAIRAAGVGAGWGYQLQSPTFVLIMAMVFFAMGLNFIGAFEIPGFLAGVGHGLTEKKGGKGSFFTGVLATVVAAPCTAPFMVTAVAFALAQPAPMAMSIFMALGLGLAAPYLLIGFVPASRRFFPKPGKWMETFRNFLAFPMFATVVWLVWVLSIQSGSAGVVLALLPMLVLAFGVWAARVLTGGKKALTLTLCAALALYPLWAIKPVVAPSSYDGAQMASIDGEAIGSMPVIPFSREKLTELRMEGKNVFIHYWAAWCMICLMHENLVFSDEDFQNYLRANNIVFMKADRTNNDPDLLTFMEASYGRSSQPIDVFYTADMNAKATVMPTLFTTGKVTQIMTEALQ